MDSKSADKKSYNVKARAISRFLFPVDITCNVCGREIFEGYFCSECEEKLPFNDGFICNHCGRRVFGAEEFCSSCNGRETYFDRARSVFVYSEPIKKLIASLKYNGKRYLAEVFAFYLARLYYSSFFNSDAVVYPPMSKERLKDRGYNQAELLAKEFSILTGIPVLDDVLVKNKETLRQATLNAADRRKNLQGSFGLRNAYLIKSKNVLVIDDVMTTGATAEILAELLVKNGAKRVDVLTVSSVFYDLSASHSFVSAVKTK